MAFYSLYRYHTGAGGETLPGAIWGTPERRQELWDWCPEIKMWARMDAAEYVENEKCPARQNW